MGFYTGVVWEIKSTGNCRNGDSLVSSMEVKVFLNGKEVKDFINWTRNPDSGEGTVEVYVHDWRTGERVPDSSNHYGYQTTTLAGKVEVEEIPDASEPVKEPAQMQSWDYDCPCVVDVSGNPIW